MPERGQADGVAAGGGAHETSDASAAALGWTALALGAGILAILLGTRLALGPREPEAPRPPAPIDLPPPPRLQADPAAERLSIRAAEERLLETYGWVDRRRGIVRIPIDRAMDLVAARGLPPPSPAPAPEERR
jgi:hypothetical protein